jgi:hypothetical protein
MQDDLCLELNLTDMEQIVGGTLGVGSDELQYEAPQQPYLPPNPTFQDMQNFFKAFGQSNG